MIQNEVRVVKRLKWFHSQKTSACVIHFNIFTLSLSLFQNLLVLSAGNLKLFFDLQLFPAMAYDQDLLDYEDDVDMAAIAGDLALSKGNNNNDTVKKAGHVSIHSSGFRDFLLKPELLRAIVDCGYEHPR